MTRRQHRFKQSGKAIDVETVYRLQSELITVILENMRRRGYVPILDERVEVLTSYNERDEIFDYEIAIYGIYVGKRRAERIYGIHKGFLIRIDGED